MTFVELILIILLVFGLYLLLSPLRRYLEAKFYKLFRSKSNGTGPVIDITDYSKKKDKPDGEF